MIELIESRRWDLDRCTKNKETKWEGGKNKSSTNCVDTG